MCDYCADYFNMFYSLLGMGFGISSFFVFYHLQNLDAGSWALVSAVFAAVVFHLHYLNYNRTLDSWHDHDTLQGIQFLGIMVLAIGMAGTMWYIFNAIYYTIPILPVKHSAYIASLWTIITAKWGLVVFVFGKLYAGVIRRENPRLLATS